MNTSGCPGGSAQDQLFLYGAAGDCSATIATFNAVFGAMVALRVVVTLMQWAVWTMRYCRPATAASKAVRNRVPFVPILSSFALVAFVLLYALSLVDVVNDANGGAPFLVGVFYFPLVLCSVMYQHRIIKLGAKIFPWAAKTKILQDGSIATQNLVKYDGVLKVNVVITGLSIAQFVVALMLLPLALDGKRMLSRVGFAALGQMFVMAGLSIGWQLQRVLDVFVEHVRTSELKHRSHSRNDGLRTAVRIFRAQQWVLCIAGCSEGLLWILNATDVLPPYWWWVPMHSAYESFTILPIVVPALAGLLKRKHSSDPAKVSVDVAPGVRDSGGLASRFGTTLATSAAVNISEAGPLP